MTRVRPSQGILLSFATESDLNRGDRVLDSGILLFFSIGGSRTLVGTSFLKKTPYKLGLFPHNLRS